MRVNIDKSVDEEAKDLLTGKGPNMLFYSAKGYNVNIDEANRFNLQYSRWSLDTEPIYETTDFSFMPEDKDIIQLKDDLYVVLSSIFGIGDKSAIFFIIPLNQVIR